MLCRVLAQLRRQTSYRSLVVSKLLPSSNSLRKELFTFSVRHYTLPDVPVAIAKLQETLSEEKITQESLLKPVEAFQPLKDSFAIVWIGGHQYKVTEGDEIMVNKLDAPISSEILLDKVLLVGTKEYTVIGTPLLIKAKVLARVEEQSKAEKIIVFFKMDASKTSRRRLGHRQPYTLLHILDVMVEK